jgi:hypothetical protein
MMNLKEALDKLSDLVNRDYYKALSAEARHMPRYPR